MKVGDTFFDPGYGIEDHLYVAVAKTDDGQVLAFNLTTHSDGCDETCVVKLSEHRWVKHKSIVAYNMGQRFPEKELDDSIRSGARKKHEDASPELLRKIQEGALVSKGTKNGYKEILIKAGIKRPGLTVVAKPPSRRPAK